MPAVIFGQNGLLSGPVGSRGPEVVALNLKGALEPLEFRPKGPKTAKINVFHTNNHFQEGLAQSKSGITPFSF